MMGSACAINKDMGLFSVFENAFDAAVRNWGTTASRKI
jgi:hypothetical protein